MTESITLWNFGTEEEMLALGSETLIDYLDQWESQCYAQEEALDTFENRVSSGDPLPAGIPAESVNVIRTTMLLLVEEAQEKVAYLEGLVEESIFQGESA